MMTSTNPPFFYLILNMLAAFYTICALCVVTSATAVLSLSPLICAAFTPLPRIPRCTRNNENG
jgi:hypothetical protein